MDLFLTIAISALGSFVATDSKSFLVGAGTVWLVQVANILF